ncbi:hypothetical protein LP419_14845 [Massilia sp. H-1]|nr:hypothetical protein LP419_14845 [Massilia sp. H-1]
MWSCALLKVMHGIFYIDSDLKLRHFNAIREQVFASLDEVILKDGEQYFLTDGEVCLPLLHYDKRATRDATASCSNCCKRRPTWRPTFTTTWACAWCSRPASNACWRCTRCSSAPAVGDQCRPPAHPQHPARPGRGQASLRQVPQPDRPHASRYPAELFEKMDRELMALSQPQTRSDNPHSGTGFSSLQVTLRKMIHLHGVEAMLRPTSRTTMSISSSNTRSS